MTELEMVARVANAIISIAAVVLVIVGAPAAWAFWRTFRKMRALLDRVSVDIQPLARHASSIADNLDYITTSIRNDVHQVNATIASANRRLQEAVELTEHRVHEFHALLQVAQEEAEQAFVSTAAAVRGVRTGVAAFGMEDELADVPAADGLGREDDDDGESDEESQRDDERPARPARPARPRVRSRGRRR